MIQQTTRGRDQNIDALDELLFLRVDAHATEYHSGAQWQITAIGQHAISHLGGQFACWGQHQGADRTTARFGLAGGHQPLQQGQGKAGGFTGAGLGTAHEIASF